MTTVGFISNSYSQRLNSDIKRPIQLVESVVAAEVVVTVALETAVGADVLVE
jgi:hypothetical protein